MNETHSQTPWTGRPLPRREDGPLLRGEATFIDDITPFAGVKEAAILRSPHGNARIISINVDKACELKGVQAALTGKDIEDVTSPIPNALGVELDQPCIATEYVRYAGEPVAVVVADSRYIAEDALDLIEVVYEELPVSVDPVASARGDAPLVHAHTRSNIIHDRTFNYGDPEGAFAKADKIVSLEIDYPRIMSTPIETYGVIARYFGSEGKFEIWSNFQGPFIGHPIIAAALNAKANNVRMISAPSSGGSFGVKWGVFVYAILIAATARKTGHPVKWIEDRTEHLAAASSSTGRHTTIEGAFNNDGRLLGVRVDQLENVGAYLRPPEPSSLYRTHGNLNGPYDVRHISVHNRVVLTNQAPSGLNRGFGAPQYYFPLERLMHEAAHQLNLDPLAIRSRNLVPIELMPYECVSGGFLDGGDYGKTLRQAADLGNYQELLAERDRARARGEVTGIGIALSIETSASSLTYVNAALTAEKRSRTSEKSGGLSTANLSANASGGFVLRLPTVPAGQGHSTVLSQLVADELGVSPDEIEVVTTLDTHQSDWSITSGNYANRFSGADTTAAVIAARKVAKKLRLIAAVSLDCDPDEVELRDGHAFVASRNTNVPIKRLASSTHWNSSNMPSGLDGGISETGVFTPSTLKAPDKLDRIRPSLTTTLMCDIAAVKIDSDTGHAEITKYAVVHDTGRILNPAIVEGQLRGGFAHGLGAALMERLEYDVKGNLLTGSFMDYLCPVALDVPELTIGHACSPTTENETGARGLGDGSSMNAPICVANAIADAIGVADVKLPASPWRVWSLTHDDVSEEVATGDQDVYGDPGIKGMLTGSGVRDLPGDPQKVWDSLFAVDELSKIIPGCRSLKEISPDNFEAEIVVAIAGIRATYQAFITLSDKHEPHSIRIAGKGESRLGYGAGEAFIELNSQGENVTQLSFRYRADVGGRIAGVGQRMLDSALNLLIRQFFNGLIVHLDPSAGKKSRLAKIGFLIWPFKRRRVT